MAKLAHKGPAAATAPPVSRAVVEPVEPRVLFAVFTVTNTLDDAVNPPVNSFRWAINQANATPNGAAMDEIHFNIPGSGTRTISPVAPLPPVTEAVVIDAAVEQPGWIDLGTPDVEATPVVEISGALAGAAADGLRINGNDVTVRGLAINRFSRFGISITGNANFLIQNNVGTSPAATAVELAGRPGLLARGNGSDGVRIVGDDNAISNTVIAFNGGAGVAVVSGSGNDVTLNPIFRNALENIDLNADGRTLNDVHVNPEDPPTDDDDGANGLLNYPVLGTPVSNAGTTTITGTVDTLANTEVFVSIFTNPTDERQGRTLLDTVFLNSGSLGPHDIPTTDFSGHGVFTLSVPTSSLQGYVTAVTASFAPFTALGFLDTSEFSDPVQVPSAVVPHVTDVYVNGTGWNPAFRGFMPTQGVGDATLGLRVTSADELRSVPWANVNQVSVRFDTDVVVDQADLQVVVRGASSTDTVAAFGGAVPFAYNATTHVATWTLAAPLPLAKVLLDLDGESVTAVTAVASGRQLDGDWANPTSPSAPAAPRPFPSGDGAAGGDFRFRFNVVPGDARRDGVTDVIEAGQAKLRTPSSPTQNPQNYSVFYDFNTGGSIDVIDAGQIKQRAGSNNINAIAGDPGGTTFAAAQFSSASIADQLGEDGVL